MGYRYHLYKVPKDFVKETQCCETLEQFREVYFKYLPESKHEMSISENTYSLYEIGQNLLCCEDGKFCDEMHLHGDTLFKSSCGRTDFPGGDCLSMRKSLKRLITTLSDDVVVYPGHDDKTTIKHERQNNLYIKR